MDAHFFLFGDLDNLFITKRDIQKNYPGLVVMDNKETLVLSVEVTHSETYDGRIRALIESMGGTLIPNKIVD